MKKKVILLIISILVNYSYLYAQNKFTANIKILGSLNNRKISFSYDDGLKTVTVSRTIENNNLLISGTYYSRFATINIDYTSNNGNSYYMQYFINNKPAQLFIDLNDMINKDNPLKSAKSINMVNVNNNYISQQRPKFSQNEIKLVDDFWNQNKQFVFKSDTITKEFYKLLAKLNQKDLQLIVENSSEYYSFWYFRTQIVNNTLKSPISTQQDFEKLLDIFNNRFPKKFTNSLEGENIKTILEGRLNNKENLTAPNFRTKDFLGKKIKLEKLRGKYVMLVFWATWCPPCMEEIPLLKQLNVKYRSNELEMIGISADHDYDKFKEVVKSENLNWKQVYGDINIPKIYGVNFYPTIFLLDKEGTIVYSSKEDPISKMINVLNENLNYETY